MKKRDKIWVEKTMEKMNRKRKTKLNQQMNGD